MRYAFRHFNCILHIQTWLFPESWTFSVNVPNYSKGGKFDPNNLKGISLVSNMCKLFFFTFVLNNRYRTWSDENNVTDAQFGFKYNCSTSETIFALLTFKLITSSLANNKRLYCVFIGSKKQLILLVCLIKLWMKFSKNWYARKTSTCYKRTI